MSSAACGPAWMPRWLRQKLFGWFFEASCIKHDDGYREGGSELRRLECDWKFLMAMLRDTFNGPTTKVPLKLVVAISFFIAVRVGGPLSFNYK